MPDFIFREGKDRTEEEKKAIQDEDAKIKAEWIKKSKKKFANEQAEKDFFNVYRDKMDEKTLKYFLEKFNNFD